MSHFYHLTFLSLIHLHRLIWNLFLAGKTSIEHILHAHYRAITDINWHTTEPNTVVSTGIDSWLWAWDLRETRKPAFGKSDQKLPIFYLIFSVLNK
jgi:hypothetical protein